MKEERSLQLMLSVKSRTAPLPVTWRQKTPRNQDEGGEDGSEERNPYGKVI